MSFSVIRRGPKARLIPAWGIAPGLRELKNVKWLGGETFVSFDKRAVSLIGKQRQATKLLT